MAEGRILLAAGRAKDAIEVYQRARAAEPLSTGVAMYLGESYAVVGRITDAQAEFDRGLKIGGLQPLLLGSGLLLALSERDRGEIPTSESRSSTRTNCSTRGAVRWRSCSTRRPLRRRRFAGWQTLPRNQVFIGYSVLASWAAAYNQPELALDYLNKIVRSSPDPSLLWRPQMRDVRKLPGFKDLLRNTGYVEDRRTYGWSDLCHPTTGDDFEC